MTYSESPFSQLSDELWHVFGGRRRFPTTRAMCLIKERSSVSISRGEPLLRAREEVRVSSRRGSSLCRAHRWRIIKTSMGVERQRQGSSGWVGAEQSRRRRALKSQHTTAIGLKEPGHSQMMTPRFRHHTWCVRKRCHFFHRYPIHRARVAQGAKRMAKTFTASKTRNLFRHRVACESVFSYKRYLTIYASHLANQK